MTGIRILDHFAPGPLPRWSRVAVGPSEVECGAGCLRFTIQNATEAQLANAEIGDYRDRSRSHLPWRPPLRLAVRARFSHPAEKLSGTSGFGFWNAPFGLADGEVLAPPNAIWFFCCSAQSTIVAAPGLPGNGFRAEMINSGTMPAWLMAVGNRLLQLPGLTPLLYRAAQTRVRASAVRLHSVEMTVWHDYVLYWNHSVAVFSVDNREVLRAQGPPAVPLGFVTWMDNQVALAQPGGEFRFGLEARSDPQWLELAHVQIEEL